jgi:predicted nucleotidyltransferase
MLKGFQKEIKKKSDEFYKKYKKKVFDILLYGSAVKGKTVPRDIDIIMIFKQVDNEEYFNLPYELKSMLESSDVGADVKGMRIEDLFNPNMLSRESILIEGYSLVHGKFLHEMLGFSSYSLFIYKLDGMNNSQKTRFQYSLKGRGDEEGMVQKTKSHHIGKGCIMVPTRFSEEFKKYLGSWGIEFREIRGLFSGYIR